MKAQAEQVGTRMIDDVVTEVDLGRRPLQCKGDSGDSYSGDALIICTGAQARWLVLESEKRFQGFGVSACATCDGFFFRDREVAIVGGGNTAVEEALFLTNFASKVTLIHRRDALRAEKIMQDRLFRNPKVAVVWDSVIDEVLGAADPLSVTGLRIKNVKTGETREIPADGLFIAIGHDPATQAFRGHLALDDEGYIKKIGRAHV